MTDAELIARLRSVHTSADDEAAADRIEALVRERDGFYEEAMHHIELWGKALAENTKLEVRLAKAVEALRAVLGACDQGRMIPRPGSGAGGMTIEANIRGCIYTGVPAWPIEEARAVLAEIEGGKDE